MPTIGQTIDLIREAHAGQKTKGGEPYWTHPVAVMTLLPGDASDDERHAALLHDVLEDTDFDEIDLRNYGYSDRTIEIVKAVTRPKGKARPTYMDWIRSIVASGDKGAMNLKLADNRHNMQADRIARLPEHERDIVNRYERSSKILTEALNV